MKRLWEGEEAENKGRGKVVKETRRSERAEPMARGRRRRRSIEGGGGDGAGI
jgi:hypothetical protein